MGTHGSALWRLPGGMVSTIHAREDFAALETSDLDPDMGRIHPRLLPCATPNAATLIYVVMCWLPFLLISVLEKERGGQEEE